jgi:separase
MGMSTDKALTVTPPTQEILVILDKAERLFSTDLAAISERGRVSQVREASVSLALIAALQSALGKAVIKGPAVVSSLIGRSPEVKDSRNILKCLLMDRRLYIDYTSQRDPRSNSTKTHACTAVG